MPSILIVDDQLEMCELFQEVFTDTEFHVVGVAHRGAEAVRLAGETQPDVVIMDIEMPDMTGIETTPLILALSPATAVVLISALDDRAYRQQAKDVGARDFVAKGVLTASRLRDCLGA